MTNPSICDSLVTKFGNIISHTPHLIVDLRNNSGGSVTAYKSILPFMYTNPVRIESGFYYSSPENIAKIKSSLSQFRDTLSDSCSSAKKFVQVMESHPHKRVLDSGFYQIRDSIYKFPEKISVIVNTKTISAAELFLLNAFQSKKVKISGDKTAGAGDQLDAHSFQLRCSNGVITIPISIRAKEFYKRDINGIGIPPHVYVDESKSDVVDFVLKYYK